MTAADYSHLPATRAEAKASGSKLYFTGRPCRHGHVDARAVSSAQCRECGRIAYDKWRSANPDAARANFKRWTNENKEKRSWERSLAYQTDRIKREPFWKRTIDIQVKCRREGVECNITSEYLMSLYEANPFCPIFGVRMHLPGYNGHRNNGVSVDRIDPNGGYVVGNVALMSYRANRLKSDLSDPEIFRRMADWLEAQQRGQTPCTSRAA